MDGAASSRIQVQRHDSPLGRWTVATCDPDARLAGIVAALWYGEGQVSYVCDRILPSDRSFLLINLGPPQFMVTQDVARTRIPFVDIWFSGLHQVPIDTEAPHGNAIIGVAFTATGAWQWLQQDQHEFADQVVPLADACGDGALVLRERLLETRGLAARFALVEQFLIARLASRRRPHPALDYALARIDASRGQASIAEIARETRLSRKHLTSLFLRHAGLPPKAIARVRRFRAALAMLAGAAAVPWSALAVQCGYYDQSHLIRDFRAFSGFTPGEFIARERPDSDSIVVR